MDPRPLEEADPELAGRLMKLVAGNGYFDPLNPDRYARIKGDQVLVFEHGKPGYTVIPGDPAGRNDPCPCGSGKKMKKCCGK